MKKKFFTDRYFPVPSPTHRMDYHLFNFKFSFLISVVQTHVANCRLCRAELPFPSSTKGLPAQPLRSASLRTESRALGKQVFFLQN